MRMTIYDYLTANGVAPCVALAVVTRIQNSRRMRVPLTRSATRIQEAARRAASRGGLGPGGKTGESFQFLASQNGFAPGSNVTEGDPEEDPVNAQPSPERQASFLPGSDVFIPEEEEIAVRPSDRTSRSAALNGLGTRAMPKPEEVFRGQARLSMHELRSLAQDVVQGW